MSTEIPGSVTCPKGCVTAKGEPKALIYASKFDPGKGRSFFKYCMKCHYVELVQEDSTWTPEPKGLETKETAEEIRDGLQSS